MSNYINTEPESLASVVREYAIIYDRSHPLFHKKEAKVNAWNQVAEQLGIESGAEAERVFIRLRDKYARANKELLVKSCSDTSTQAEIERARQKVKSMFYLEWLEEFIKHRDRPTIRIKGKTEQDYDGYDDSDMKDPPTMHDLDFERTKSTAESPPDTPCSYSEHIAAEPASKKWRMVSTTDDGEASINEGAPSHSKSLNVQSTTSWPQAAITDSVNRHDLSVPMPQQAENTNKRLLSRSDDDTYANSRNRNHRFTSLKRKNSAVVNSASSQQDEFDLFGQYVALKMRKLHSRLSSEQLEDLEFDILNTIERTRRQNRQVENDANTTGVDEGHFNGHHD